MTDPVTNYCAAILGENQIAMEAIRYIPEFAECSDRLLNMIYRYSKPVDLKPGEILIKEGNFDQWVYFVIKGNLEVVVGGKTLGTSTGPVVGERCILGEPRGADLIAGDKGLMALGVEMSIIDALNREINNYRNETEDPKAVEDFIEDRMSIILELLTIVLKDVTKRIADIYQTGVSGANHLEKSKKGLNIQLKSLYTFHEKPKSTSDDDETTKQITLFSFEDFSETVYYEVLQKCMSNFGFLEFPLEDWKAYFKVDENNDVKIAETFAWMKQTFKISNQKLVDIATAVFEIASQYTAASNRSINVVLAEFDDDSERRVAVNMATRSDNSEREQMAAFIQQELFDPIEAKLKSGQAESGEQKASKMSQADIDALFD